MNLNQLRYALAVAESGNFTRAAAQCYVTQPTLSNGLALLEEEFGEKLFVRTTRTVSLTPFGEHILPFIEKVVNAQAELVNAYRSYVHPQQDAIRIGVSPLVQTGRFAALLASFREAHAQCEVIFTEQNMADLYRMLDEDALDFIFGVSDESSRSSRTRAYLYEEPLFYIPRAGVLPGTKEAVTLDDIADETFVMVPDGCGLARATRTLFRSHRRRLKEYPGEALSYQVLEEWASLGLGAAILPDSKLQKGTSMALPILGKDGKPLTLSFEATWKSQAQSSSRAQFLRELSSYAVNA